MLQCLQVFGSSYIEKFDPLEDRYFVSGGYAQQLRIWNVTNGRVSEWAQAPSIISSVRYNPRAKHVVAGFFDGRVMFYSLHGGKMKYFTRIISKDREQRTGERRL